MGETIRFRDAAHAITEYNRLMGDGRTWRLVARFPSRHAGPMYFLIPYHPGGGGRLIIGGKAFTWMPECTRGMSGPVAITNAISMIGCPIGGQHDDETP